MRLRMYLKGLTLFSVLVLASCGTDASRIENPEVGDVYQIEWKNMEGDEYAYQLVKVLAIEGDKLQLAPNKLYYKEKVYCLINGDYFSLKDSYQSSKKEMQAVFDKGGVVDVFRHYEDECLGASK